jgi:hypothetical protein
MLAFNGGATEVGHAASVLAARACADPVPTQALHVTCTCHVQDKVDAELEQAYGAAEQERLLRTAISYRAEPGTPAPARSLLRDLFNISPVLTDGAAAIIDDSFNKCFTCMEPDPWNWNAYLWPQWFFGLVLRHYVLFPLRLVVLLILNVLFIGAFFIIGLLYKPGQRRKELELKAIQVARVLHMFPCIACKDAGMFLGKLGGLNHV